MTPRKIRRTLAALLVALTLVTALPCITKPTHPATQCRAVLTGTCRIRA